MENEKIVEKMEGLTTTDKVAEIGKMAQDSKGVVTIDGAVAQVKAEKNVETKEDTDVKMEDTEVVSKD